MLHLLHPIIFVVFKKPLGSLSVVKGLSADPPALPTPPTLLTYPVCLSSCLYVLPASQLASLLGSSLVSLSFQPISLTPAGCLAAPPDRLLSYLLPALLCTVMLNVISPPCYVTRQLTDLQT
jgi:hypothetical protein